MSSFREKKEIYRDGVLAHANAHTGTHTHRLRERARDKEREIKALTRDLQ